MSSSVEGAGISASTITVTPTLGSPNPAPPAFWGINIIGDRPLGPIVSDLAKTPFTYQIYPGGNVSERANLSNGVIYKQGSEKSLEVTASDFATECDELKCKSIVELPMEVDNPGADVADARYIVETLHFHPTYFLYGNEPGRWFCYGTSWTALAEGKCSGHNATFVQFATETQLAVGAVDRALGSAAPPALCLGGAGNQPTSAYELFIGALLNNTFDRSVCHGFEIHSHPASSIHATPTLSNFYATLTDFNSAYAIYRNLTGHTDGIPLDVDELSPVTYKSAYVIYEGTWAWNVYSTALLLQSMQDLYPNDGWWAWNTGDNGGLYNGQLTPVFPVYSTIAEKLGSTWYATNYDSQDGLFMEATQGGGIWTLVAVNTNITQPFKISLTGTVFAEGSPPTVSTWTSTGWKSTVGDPLWGIPMPEQSIVVITAT